MGKKPRVIDEDERSKESSLSEGHWQQSTGGEKTVG